MPIRIILMPRFDYGMLKPWILQRNNGKDFVAIGGHQGLLFSSDIGLRKTDDHGCMGTFVIQENERKYISIIHRPPHLLDSDEVEAPDKEEIERRFEETIEWWHTWASQADYEGPYREHAMRSAVVLKGLNNAPTGAIAAAATTSLPEEIGGSRNWDYRFTWVRDSVFAEFVLPKRTVLRRISEFGNRSVPRFATGSIKTVTTTSAAFMYRRPNLRRWMLLCCFCLSFATLNMMMNAWFEPRTSSGGNSAMTG
jgi:hypothetical protein